MESCFVAQQVYGSFKFNHQTMECDMARDLASFKARKIMILIEAFIPVLTILVLYIFIFIMVSIIILLYLRKCA